MKNIKKIFAIVLVALMTVTFCACAAQASEAVSQETVKEVQQALNEAGFDCGTPDGIAGNNTKNAISEYQKANGLTVTGEIDDKLLKSLFPPEEPEKEEPAAETKSEEVTTELTAEAEKPAEEKKSEVTDGEVQYGMTEDDAMYFTFDDDVLYRLVIDENGYANYDKMTDKESVEKSIRINYLPNHIQMINYVVEKYFYAAIAEENNLPMREIEKANMEDWNVIREDDAQKEYDPDFFKWDDYFCKLIFVRNDTTWIMYYEDNHIKVGKLVDEEVTEVISFDYEEAKEETETFVDFCFINARLTDFDDSDFLLRIMYK